MISEEEIENNKVFLLGQALHLADISNPCRSWEVASRWTDLVFREFFYQGDLERALSLPISQLCDRKTVNIAQSQVGFINFLVLPVFQEFAKLCQNLHPLIQRAEQNKKAWEELKEVFETHKEAAQRLVNHEEDLGGVEGDYFSYENYIRRKFKTAENNQEHQLQQSTQTAHFIHNQRKGSFMTRRSSINKGERALVNQENSEKTSGVFVLEQINSSSSNESVSATNKDEDDAAEALRQKFFQRDLIDEEQEEEGKSSYLTKSENTF